MATQAPIENAAASYSEYQYGDQSELQSMGVWDFQPSPAQGADTAGNAVKYWVVFIHGGAWRDPRVTFHAIEPAISQLSASRALRSRVAGVASLNYRLTRHPDFPQDPATTAPAQLRDARHPDHVRDIVAALTRLAALRPLAGPSTRYLLAGHSAGATLALQVLMGASADATDATTRAFSSPSSPLYPFPAPAAIIGYEGIYDLRDLCDRKNYSFLFVPPFGDDRATWDRLSPALHRGFAADWAAWAAAGADAAHKDRKRLAVIAQSTEDELVDMDEALAMERALREDGVPFLMVTDLKGKHNEVLQSGTEIVKALVQTLDALEV